MSNKPKSVNEHHKKFCKVSNLVTRVEVKFKIQILQTLQNSN